LGQLQQLSLDNMEAEAPAKVNIFRDFDYRKLVFTVGDDFSRIVGTLLGAVKRLSRQPQ
jgi:hypothetical protein